MIHSVEANGSEIVAVLLEIGIGMAPEGHAGDPMAGLLNTLCHHDRQSSLSSDESDWL